VLSRNSSAIPCLRPALLGKKMPALCSKIGYETASSEIVGNLMVARQANNIFPQAFHNFRLIFYNTRISICLFILSVPHGDVRRLKVYSVFNSLAQAVRQSFGILCASGLLSE
jgi:hypothetical protein